MSMYKLYELSDAMNRVAEMIEEGVEGLEDTLEAIEGTFQDKVESIVKLIRSKKAECAAINIEIDRLQKRANSVSKSADWLLNYIEREMKQANKTEIKSPLFTIKLQMSPPSTVIEDASLLPAKYQRHVPASSAPDKVAIKEAIQSGVSVPGARLHQELRLAVK